MASREVYQQSCAGGSGRGFIVGEREPRGSFSSESYDGVGVGALPVIRPPDVLTVVAFPLAADAQARKVA